MEALALGALVALFVGESWAELGSGGRGTGMRLGGRDGAGLEVLGGSRRDRTVWLAAIRRVRGVLPGPLLLQEAERRHQDEVVRAEGGKR